MTFDEYLKRLDEIEQLISESRRAAPADGEMVRDDIVRLFNAVSRLESETRYMDNG